jgi:hypothetical protein
MTRVNRKSKLTLKNMKGGAAAAAAPPPPPAIPKSYEFDIGIQIEDFFSDKPYAPRIDNIYSDHAPILYNIPNNPYLNIITWNVAKYSAHGWPLPPKPPQTFEHKFRNLKAAESEPEYEIRLGNISEAIDQMFKNHKSSKGTNPLIMLQELPTEDKYMKILIDNLVSKGCLLLCDKIDTGSVSRTSSDIKFQEYGIVIKKGDTGYNFADTSDQDFQDLLLVIESDVDLTWGRGNRFNVKLNKSNTFNIYFINVHCNFQRTEVEIMEDINKLIIKIINFSKKTPSVKPNAFYIVGDFNKRITGDAINQILYPTAKQKYVLTTYGKRSYSMSDNEGTYNPHNVDLVIHVAV